MENKLGNGVLSQIKDNTPSNTYPMTATSFDTMCKEIFANMECQYRPEIVLYTGWLGMITYNLAMLGLHMNLNIKLWAITTPKVRGMMYYFSLFKKSGLVKIKVVLRHEEWVFECYRNTTYLFTCKDITEFVMKALHSIHIEEETVKQYTNQELLEMRQWVRENFVPRVDDVDPKWHKVMKDEASRMAEEQDREADEVNFNED